MFATDPQNPPRAISAVKALALANAGGQRIYQVTPANQAATLLNIRHDAGTMAEIRAALAVGKTVITHTDPVSVPGWSGAGYIILDPDTGEGAYRIGGGLDGSWIIIVVFLILAIAILATILSGQVYISALLIWQYWVFAQRVKFIAATYEPDRAYEELKKAAFLTALGSVLAFSPLLGSYKEIGAETVALLRFASFFVGLWGAVWYS